MRICPFCLSKIESNNVDFLFEKEFADWDFMESMGGADEFVLNAREDRKYRKFREKKKLSITDRADTMRVYVNHGELYQLINILRRRCGMDHMENVWDENNCIDETFTFEDGMELTIQYSNKENEDSVLTIQSGIQAARASMICSNCHNILPSGFFHYPQITVGLIGKKDAGKTCMLVSLLANNMKAINGSKVLHFTEAQTMQDSNYRELRRKVMLLEEQGICPDSTRGEFIAPVMLRAEWSIEEERHYAMVCIYDAAGELLEKASENTDILENIMHTDGWLYLIDPQNTRLGTMVETLSQENKIAILERAGIGNIYQQRKKQQDVHKRGHRTVHDVMQELLTDVNTEAQIRNFYNHLWQCYLGQGLREDDFSIPEVALILSKSDEMISFLNEKYGEADLFNRELNYISAEGNEHCKDRKEIIRKIFEEYVIDVDNLNADYPSVPDVYLASALGCSTKQENTEGETLVYKVDGIYDPIRVGEAFVRTTMNLMQNRSERNSE
ncbi:MAG: hypothetical protein Q4E73_01625 [Lachnospiraceae bacterium]|nr:hypothetical protein [Lachnospiraceae bacterium]